MGPKVLRAEICNSRHTECEGGAGRDGKSLNKGTGGRDSGIQCARGMEG